MGLLKNDAARLRQAEDDYNLRLEYEAMDYLNRSRQGIPERFPVDDEQPEKPAQATTQKPHANDH